MIVWRHHKSDNLYEVLHYGLMERNLSPVVIYRRIGSEQPVFVRPTAEFMDGRFIPEEATK